MGKVTAGFSMSLDGFVADPNDGVTEVFKWYFTGSAGGEVRTGDATFTMTSEGADSIKEAGRAAGSTSMGCLPPHAFAVSKVRRADTNTPVVVVTHTVPQEWADREGSPFTFVTDGVESAIEKARQIAGDKDIRLVDHVGTGPIELELVEASGTPHITHRTYRVVK